MTFRCRLSTGLSAGSHIKDYTGSIGDDSSNDYYTARRKDQKTRGGERGKHYLRQKGQAVNKHRDILDAIHKVARYIDGFLLQSQNGCQICSTGLEEVPEKGRSWLSSCKIFGQVLLSSFLFIIYITHALWGKFHQSCSQKLDCGNGTTGGIKLKMCPKVNLYKLLFLIHLKFWSDNM